MKKLMQFIESIWKELIVAALMAVMGYELVQVNLELNDIQERLGSSRGHAQRSTPDLRSDASDTGSLKSDIRSVGMRLTSLESSVRTLKSKVSSVESELSSLDRKIRY